LTSHLAVQTICFERKQTNGKNYQPCRLPGEVLRRTLSISISTPRHIQDRRLRELQEGFEKVISLREKKDRRLFLCMNMRQNLRDVLLFSEWELYFQ